MSVTEDEFSNSNVIEDCSLGGASLLSRMEEGGETSNIGFCSFSFGAVPIRTPYRRYAQSTS